MPVCVGLYNGHIADMRGKRGADAQVVAFVPRRSSSTQLRALMLVGTGAIMNKCLKKHREVFIRRLREFTIIENNMFRYFIRENRAICG
jgi:hypothetical protein